MCPADYDRETAVVTCFMVKHLVPEASSFCEGGTETTSKSVAARIELLVGIEVYAGVAGRVDLSHLITKGFSFDEIRREEWD